MHRALAALGLTRLPHACVQVVGTNGKGSTATLLAALCSAHGLGVGLSTSPHFLSVRERIRLYRGGMPGDPGTPGAPLRDGLLSEADWLDAARECLAATAGFGPSGQLTYFELLTVMAAWLFAARGADVAVYEAGLGGSHDATTALPRDMAVFTPMGMDHAGVLGPTIGHIARDKAGAISEGGLAVTSGQPPEAMDALADRARQARAELVPAREAARFDATSGTVRFPAEGLEVAGAALGMPGSFQAENAATALAAFSVLAGRMGLPVSGEAVRRALAATRIAGRMQRLAPTWMRGELLLDCAHNVPAMQTLEAALAAGGIRPSAMVFTCLADKDFAGMSEIVTRLSTGPILVPGLSCPGRTRDPADVARTLGPRAEAFPDAAAALGRCRDLAGTILVCGSMYLLSEVLGLADAP
ncbi:MAG: bifunctional folylpolyglutamate synthase/dihydrofolate synthase [Thermodesulfobacteriota bacterium]